MAGYYSSRRWNSSALAEDSERFLSAWGDDLFFHFTVDSLPTETTSKPLTAAAAAASAVERLAATALPDLIIDDVEIEGDPIGPGQEYGPNFRAGDEVTLLWDVDNRGSGSAGSSRVAIWLISDVDGMQVETNLTNSLSAGGSDTNETDTFTIPATLDPGLYGIRIIADDRNEVAESNEGNNEYLILIRVDPPGKPDLVVDDVEINGDPVPKGGQHELVVHPGDEISLLWDVDNNGTGPAASSRVGIYLSVGGETIRVDTAATDALAAGSSDNNTTDSFTLLSTLEPGVYEIELRGDYEGVVAESNESNNSYKFSIRVESANPTGSDQVREGTDTLHSLGTSARVTGTIDAEPMSGDVALSDGQNGLIDKDWYKVVLDPGKVYTFDATSTSITTGKVVISLYETNDLRVKGPVEGAAPSLTFDMTGQTTSKVYYLAVSAGGPDPGWKTATGNYTAGMTSGAAPPSGADTVANDKGTTASLAIGGSITGTINSSDVDGSTPDKDWYKVNLVAGHTYRFTGSGTSGSLDLVAMRVYNSSAVAVSELADNSAALTFTPSSSGDYFLALSAGGPGDAWKTKTGNFTVSVMDTTGPTVSTDSVRGDKATGATLGVGTITGTIDANDISGDTVDRDYYKVVLTGGHRYTFSADARVSDADTLDFVFIRLRDAAGNVLSPGRAEDGIRPVLTFEVPGAGNVTYYLAVSAGGTNFADKTGRFELTLTDNGLVDVTALGSDKVHGTTSSAEALIIDGSVLGAINAFDISGSGTDVDYLRMTLTGGYEYTFIGSAGVSSVDTLDSIKIRLLDSSGNALPVDRVAAGPNPSFVYAPSAAGSATYFLAVSASAVGSKTTGSADDKTGQYKITVIDPPVQTLSPSGFDHPWGTLDANGRRTATASDGYSIASEPGSENFPGRYHLGEDWNWASSPGMTHSDLGKEVFSIANGYVRVVYTGDPGGTQHGWGGVVIVEHLLPGGKSVWALYGHLSVETIQHLQDKIDLPIYRGDLVGKVGNVAGLIPHLHLELRSEENWLNQADGLVAVHEGYFNQSNPTGWLDPSDFINSHRGFGDVNLSSTGQDSQINGQGNLLSIFGNNAIPSNLTFDMAGTTPRMIDGGGGVLATFTGFFELGFNGSSVGDAVRYLPLGGSDIKDNTLLFDGRGGGDTLDGSLADKRIVASGGEGDDILKGGAKGDELRGDIGDDTLAGGGGDDLLRGGRLAPASILELTGSDLVDEQLLSTISRVSENGSGALYLAGIETGAVQITNQTRSEFAFLMFDAGYAAANGLHFAGNNVLTVPGGGQGSISDTVRVRLSDEGRFAALSIKLDTTSAETGISATFTGYKADGTTVVTSFGLDAVQGLQTFTFGSAFSDLVAMEFAATSGMQFDGLRLSIVPSDNDVLDGGDGNDTADYSASTSPVVVDLSAALNHAYGADVGIDQISNVENVIGGSGNDFLTGNVGANRLDGGPGADVLTGRGGEDTYIVDDPADAVIEGAGEGASDRVYASVSYTLAAGAYVETLSTPDDNGTSPLTLAGNELDNRIIGNAGANLLYGMGGIDRLEGLAGDDRYVVDHLNDVVVEAAAQGYDTVYSSVHYTLATGSEVEALSALDRLGTNLLDLAGNEHGNAIFGNAGANQLSGFAGDDWLDGGAGDDRLDGGTGFDGASYIAAGAAVTVSLATIAAQNTGGAGTDTLVDVENLFGSPFGDVLTGNGFANVLDGREGVDTMRGGAGDDTYYVDNVGDVVEELAGEGFDTVCTSLAVYSLVGTQIERLGSASDIAHDFRGSAGNNIISGGAGGDLIRLQDGGDDRASGGDGGDAFYFGSAFTNADVADGGAGRDAVILQGNYTATLSAANLIGIEALSLQSGSVTAWGDTANSRYDYNLTTTDNFVAAGVQLIVNGQSLLLGEDLTFDGSAESDGQFLFYAGHGTDNLKGGALGDVFFFEGQRWSSSDRADGGAGTDVLVISAGTGSNRFVFTDTSFVNIEAISVSNRFVTDPSQKPSYELVLANGNVLAGQSLIVNANSLADPGQVITIDGSSVQAGRLTLYGGAGNDTLIGGGGADLIYGADGADDLTGGGGADVFRFDSASESDPGAADEIIGFQSGVDRIDLSRIDANSNAAGDQAFAWIGGAAFSGVAGQLRAYDAGTTRWIEGDTDGDGDGDFTFAFRQITPLETGDFIL